LADCYYRFGIVSAYALPATQKSKIKVQKSLNSVHCIKKILRWAYIDAELLTLSRSLSLKPLRFLRAPCRVGDDKPLQIFLHDCLVLCR